MMVRIWLRESRGALHAPYWHCMRPIGIAAIGDFRRMQGVCAAGEGAHAMRPYEFYVGLSSIIQPTAHRLG